MSEVQWTPEQVFLATWTLASLGGVAILLRSGDKITPRNFIAAILYNGLLGLGLGMIGWELLGGKQQPWRVIGCGALVGIRIIQLQDIRSIVKSVLGLKHDNGHGKPGDGNGK